MSVSGMLIGICSCADGYCSVPVGLLAAPAPKPQWDPQLLIYSLLIVAALLVGALIIAIVNRWRLRSGGRSLSASDQLTQYRSLYERGEISQEEYERLRSLLGGRIRSDLDSVGTREDAPPGKRTVTDITDRPSDPTKPQKPSGYSPPPETGGGPA